MNVSKSALSSGGKAGTKENKILKRKPNGSKCPSVGIAQKKLVLKPINKKSEDKKAVEPTVRPSPFVLKTNMYDEHWIKKQERGIIYVYIYMYIGVCVGYIYIICRSIRIDMQVMTASVRIKGYK